MKKAMIWAVVVMALTMSAKAQNAVSVAGLFDLPDDGRDVWNMSPCWKFYLGDVEGGESLTLDDSQWQTISVPHSVALEPAEASGCRNYQGVAWYRKWFVVPQECKGNRVVDMHFEGIMGKQVFYVNGKEVERHEGGYLPVTLHLSDYGVKAGDRCLIAVRADNSDDKTYPPGKTQMTLDFSYHGGIYRDVWLIAKGQVHITDAVAARDMAGGGIFVHYSDLSERKATVHVETGLKNTLATEQIVTIEQRLVDTTGKLVAKDIHRETVPPGSQMRCSATMHMKSPHLWSPEDPYLYRLETRVRQNGIVVDGGMTRIGIRFFEFRDADGFWLNGHRYHQFVGANRHQDFAYVGNALPNSQQWRDALRLRNAGFTIIRTAHYPQDPAFMDACDELGMFVIVATPGWQYWNKAPEFAEKVQENTREIIRRDRNHPCVLMWEPILNETRFPEQFALDALAVTREEYPYPYRPVAAADMHSAGIADNYDVVYGWPGDDEKADRPRQCIFTREFGELVDDWYAHNNLNRASRSWGERPQLMQAMSLSKSIDEMYHTTGQFIGGCLWHPFDHQRGYHPDPYWGGIYDAFRQKKTAYWAFRSQSPANYTHPLVESGPMVHLSHEMTQFSDSDVVVFSNCDSVRLSIYDGEKQWTLPVSHEIGHLPNAPVEFKGVWDFFEARQHSYFEKDWQKVNITAEGIIDGKVVCTDRRMPSRRSTKLRLYVDEEGCQLTADGNDFVVVVAEVTDDNGNVRRLAKEEILFSVEGEGEIIGDASIGANPHAVEWGSAPVLIRSTRQAGKITVRATVLHPGTHAPTPAEITFESIAPIQPLCFEETTDNGVNGHSDLNGDIGKNGKSSNLTDEEKQQMLEEVQQQQADFGIKFR